VSTIPGAQPNFMKIAATIDAVHAHRHKAQITSGESITILSHPEMFSPGKKGR
jgi:hypothetical protein